MFTFYKPNFCCDCGTNLSKENWNWKQKLLLKKHFCKKCFNRLKFKTSIKYSLLLLFLFPLLLFLKAAPPKENSFSSTNLPNTTVSQNIDNISINAYPINKPKENELLYVCGAKTRKGTKCQRKVRISGYCWQHKVIIEDKSKSEP